jgi:hypothetical protein
VLLVGGNGFVYEKIKNDPMIKIKVTPSIVLMLVDDDSSS